MPEKKDPCDESLEGKTKLMLMIEGRDEDGVRVAEKGDVDEVRALLEARADPNEMSVGSGATALHLAASSLQTDIVGVLLEFGAEPWKIDRTGFSPWMVVGEESAHKRGTDGAWHAREEDEIKSPKLQKSRQDLLELLKPKPSFTLDDILSKLQEGWQTAVDPAFIGGPVTGESLAQRWRLRESLFFDSEVARERGAHNGRQPRTEWLRSFAKVLFKLLKNERVEGNQDEHVEGSQDDHEVLTRYLLRATTGPIAKSCCHIHTPWQTQDNRGEYRKELTEVVNEMLAKYAEEANEIRRTIDEHAERGPNNPCAQLLELPKERLTVPPNWLQSNYKEHQFWQEVQKSNMLKNDPPWAKEAGDSPEKLCGQLVRLGEFVNAEECFKRIEGGDPDSLAVLFARGYVHYSNRCNEPFQQRVKEAAKGVCEQENIVAKPPAHIVPAKTLERVLMKAQKFGRDKAGTNCFRILDTVRLSFTCQGETVHEQVETCMTLFKEFKKFTVEGNKVVVVRHKSGFAKNVSNVGGYADLKLLVFADLGSFADSDGELMPLRIVGEVQLLLPGYQELARKDHLLFEVYRGSFD